jgi:mRNA interferase MazF
MKLRWTLHYANLDPVVGSEQGKTRPVLVINEEVDPKFTTLTILPLTSRKPERTIYPNEVLLPSGTGGLEKESIVLCHQIRTLDKKRFIKFIGIIDDIQIQQDIAEALRFHLGI